MAKRGRRKGVYSYIDSRGNRRQTHFRDLNKTYKNYVEKYYQKARQLRKKLSGGIARGRGRVSNAELRGYMYDPDLLSKSQFIAEYRKVKEQLIANDSSADPTQYIVSQQAYKFSEAQYRAFTKAIKSDEIFAEFRGMSREEFRSGAPLTYEFRRKLSEVYRQKKEHYRELGWLEEDVLRQAAEDMGSLYYGSK